MRFGRILLALLAPLVSLPALAADGAQDHLRKAPSQTPDSLSNLLRSVAPPVVAADSASHGAAYAPRIAPLDSAAVTLPGISASLAPAAEASVRLLTRQQHRSLLRC